MHEGGSRKVLFGMNERWRVVLLLAVAMLAYGNTLVNGFTFDDGMYIVSNPAATHPSPRTLFAPTRSNNVLRPVTFATLALNWRMGGRHPFGYHLFNLFMHAAVVLLLYLVLRRLLDFTAQRTMISFAAAMLFAVHPIHTEAVASIVGRSELLATGFLLAAWLLHLQDRRIPALVSLVLALMSKESAVAFIPLVLAGDYARGALKPLRRHAWVSGVTMLYLALFWKLKGGRFGELSISFLDNPLASLPASLRILNALRIAWKYIALDVYPARLSCDYSYNAILLYAKWSHGVLAVVATLLVFALWIWAMLARRNEWFLAGAIYFGGFAATANLLVPTGTIMGERLAYLPSAGFCLLVALGLARLERSKRTVAWTVFTIVVLVLATRTAMRNRDWHDNFSLFSTDVRVVPGSAKVHCNLGGEYLHLGQLEAAHAELQTALHIYPDFPEALEFYGLVEARMGHGEEARRSLEKALASIGTDSIDYSFWEVNLAALLIQLGQNDRALILLNQATVDSPENARAWSNRAVIHYQRGEMVAARADAETALRLEPSNAQAQSVLNSLSSPTAVAPVR
jgi:protein O-mannosyl-transferase